MIVSQRIAESVSRTVTETFEEEFNGAVAAQFIVDITAGAGAGDTVTITIDGYDPASKTWYNLLTGVALIANATTVYRVGLDYTAAANVTAVDFLPKRYRVVATKNNATAITFSIGANSVE